MRSKGEGEGIRTNIVDVVSLGSSHINDLLNKNAFQ